MNVMRHKRIERIKRLSGYLRLFLSLISYGLVLMVFTAFVFPLIGMLPIEPSINPVIKTIQMPPMQKIGISVVILAFSLLPLFSVRYACELMTYFSKGEIFNRRALLAARKAILFGLGSLLGPLLLKQICLLFMGGNFFGLGIYPFLPLIPSLTESLFYGLMFFGLMYVLLWALEIGTELNEESELTI
jgi:hypothetical protein